MDQEENAKRLLGQLWGKHFPEMLERVEILQQASDLLQQDQLSEEARRAALSAAHKLAGALGTFGRAEGTVLARSIEACFSDPYELPNVKDRIKTSVKALRGIVVL